MYHRGSNGDRDNGYYTDGWLWVYNVLGRVISVGMDRDKCTCMCNLCLHASLWIEGSSLTEINVRINRFVRSSK